MSTFPPSQPLPGASPAPPFSQSHVAALTDCLTRPPSPDSLSHTLPPSLLEFPQSLTRHVSHPISHTILCTHAVTLPSRHAHPLAGVLSPDQHPLLRSLPQPQPGRPPLLLSSHHQLPAPHPPRGLPQPPVGSGGGGLSCLRPCCQPSLAPQGTRKLRGPDGGAALPSKPLSQPTSVPQWVHSPG